MICVDIISLNCFDFLQAQRPNHYHDYREIHRTSGKLGCYKTGWLLINDLDKEVTVLYVLCM